MVEQRKLRAADHDQFFKRLITEFFREFIELFLPAHAKLLDFDSVNFLDKEDFTDFPAGKRRHLDLLAEVQLMDGGEEVILVHTEFQSYKQADFAERMFLYYAQLYVRHQRPILPIALFTDDAEWQNPVPDHYSISVADTEYVHFYYELIKLKHLDYRKYLESNNPLAYTLMAKMGYDELPMSRLKADFLRLLSGTGVDQRKMALCVNFIDAYMPLSEEDNEEFLSIMTTEEAYTGLDDYITSFEARGIEKGREKGREEGREEGREAVIEEEKARNRQLIRRAMNGRFGEYPKDIAILVDGAEELQSLETILEALVMSDSLDGLRKYLSEVEQGQ